MSFPLIETQLLMVWQLQDLATSMLELWHLMDTPIEEQQVFQNVTCNIAASEDEVTESNSLSEDFINHVSCKLLEKRSNFLFLSGSKFMQK